MRCKFFTRRNMTGHRQGKGKNRPEEYIVNREQIWQIEILIASGLILFLYYIPDFLTRYLWDIAVKRNIDSTEMILYYGGYIFSRALLIGFVLSLFLRTIWLAFLGIYAAYPKGINFHLLNYTPYFNKYVQNYSSPRRRVKQFDKICSLTFSVTIIVTLQTIGLFGLMAVIFNIIAVLFPAINTPNVGIIILVILFLLMLGVTDWFFFGLLKKYPLIGRIYMPFYKFFRWITLSSFYQPELLTFISNIKRWKANTVFALFFTFSFFLVLSETSQQIDVLKISKASTLDQRRYVQVPTLKRINPVNYDSLRPANKPILTASLQSDIITGGILKIFVVYLKRYDATLDSLVKKYSVQSDFKVNDISDLARNDSLWQNALNDLFNLKIDRERLENLQWYKYKHPQTGEIGFVTYVPVDSLPKGPHTLYLRYLRFIDKQAVTSHRAIIPFILR